MNDSDTAGLTFIWGRVQTHGKCIPPSWPSALWAQPFRGLNYYFVINSKFCMTPYSPFLMEPGTTIHLVSRQPVLVLTFKVSKERLEKVTL